MEELKIEEIIEFYKKMEPEKRLLVLTIFWQQEPQQHAAALEALIHQQNEASK